MIPDKYHRNKMKKRMRIVSKEHEMLVAHVSVSFF
jgi:hypothetical protein